MLLFDGLFLEVRLSDGDSNRAMRGEFEDVSSAWWRPLS